MARMSFSGLFKVLQVFIIIGLIYFFFVEIDFQKMLYFFNIQFMMAILLAQVPIFIATFLTGLRHVYFINMNVSILKGFYAVVISNGFNNILPARISEVLKATYLRDKCKVPFSIGISAVFLERLIDLMIVSLLVLTLTLFLAVDMNTTIAFIMLSISLIGMFITVFFQKKIFKVIEKYVKWKRLQSFIHGVLVHVTKNFNSVRLINGLLLGISIWCFSSLTVGIFINVAGSIELGALPVITILIAGAIGLAIPGLPGGLGVFEASIVTVLLYYGYNLEYATALAIGLRLSNILFIFPFSLYLAMFGGTGLKNIIFDIKNKTNN